jgi:predicted amidohydrolase
MPDTPKTIRVAAVQFESAPGDKPANLAKIRAFTAQAAAQGVQIVAFPECSVTGYWFLRKLSRDDFAALAEPVPGPTTQALLDLSREFNITLGAGFIEAGPDGKFYKPYVVAMPGGTYKSHRKLHAFVSPYLACGDQYTVFDTPHGVRVGVLICYDLNLNENARITALMGAQILLAPHQTGGCRTTNPHLMGVIDRAAWDNRHNDPDAIRRELRGDKGRGWLMRWLPSRAHDNGMFLVFANGIGVDDDEIRTGNSMVLDPYGRILAETDKAGDDMVIADLDLSLIPESSGQQWIMARRPELYKPLTIPTGRERSTREIKFKE